MGTTTTICFTNNKGGSGKSTTCSNLGAAMARDGKKVLLVDGDMQLNLSLSVFPEDWVLEHAKSEKNLYYAIQTTKLLKICLTTYLFVQYYLQKCLMPINAVFI